MLQRMQYQAKKPGTLRYELLLHKQTEVSLFSDVTRIIRIETASYLMPTYAEEGWPRYPDEAAVEAKLAADY